MKKKIVFLLAAVLMMAGCREKGGEDMAEQKDFETMTIAKSDITLSQNYPASIEGRQSVKIIPRVEGYLRQICVKEGQRVKKGQVLFVIDQATYQAEVKAAEANVAVAKAGGEPRPRMSARPFPSKLARSRSALPLGLSKNLFACLSKSP